MTNRLKRLAIRLLVRLGVWKLADGYFDALWGTAAGKAWVYAFAEGFREASIPGQDWFWSKRWQHMEREADADIATGRVEDWDIGDRSWLH